MWDKTVPVTGSYIVDIPSIFSANWTALEDITGVEHYSLADALAGRHKPGITHIMSSAATSAITGTTSPSTGAMAQDIEKGVHYIYDGNSWEQINLLAHSEVIAYRNADYTITAGTTGLIPFDTEISDTLSEYNNSTYLFTATTAGFYYIRAHASFTATGTIEVGIVVEHYDINDVLLNMPLTYKNALSADEFHHGITLILALSIGDKIKVKVTHNKATGIVLEGGSDRNFLNIYRMS